MMKILWIAFVLIGGFRLLTGRWPWDLLGGGGRPNAASEAERKARALLGVGPAARHGEIIEAHRRLVAMVHPDRGGTNQQVHEANDARDLLLARLPQG